MQSMVPRRTVDHTAPLLLFAHDRLRYPAGAPPALPPTLAGALRLPAPAALPAVPAANFATKLLHASLNKVKSAVNALAWTPDARRLITGSQQGEFTLWQGTSYHFENIVQARHLDRACTVTRGLRCPALFFSSPLVAVLPGYLSP